MIRAALALAEVDPATVGYVEAHGTATPLGDPIEVAALRQAFGAAPAGGCALGSIKGNLGHLDAAAGVAGFVKAVLVVREGRIPPTLHAERPNPALGLDGSPFRLAAGSPDGPAADGPAAEWPAAGGPRRAGVSSFGIGGTNAHVVVEQPPPPEPSGPGRRCQLLVLAAATGTALDAAAARLADHLDAHPGDAPADVAATLARGRRAFAHRAALVAAGRAAATAALRGGAPGLRRGRAPEGSRAVAFLFPGQGAQRPGAGRELYRGEPAFRRPIDRCAEVLGPLAEGAGLVELLFPESGDPGAAGRLTRTAAAQPALFALELALAALWREWGIEPQAMLGHSVGEYAAACLAGVFTLEDGLALVAERGRLMDAAPEGAMLAVPLPAAEVEPRLDGGRGGLAVAAVNAPRLTAVSGPAAEIERLAAALAADGVATRRLRTSRAFHGPAMEPAAAAFAERVARVPLAPPRIPFVSSLTGAWITAAEATDPGYWARHLRRPVRFADGVALLAGEPSRLFLEVGPGRTLTALVRRNLGGDGPVAIPSLPGEAGESRGDLEGMLGALAELWLAGAEVDWRGFYAHQRRRRLELPPYPFERRSYRVSAPAAVRPAPAEIGAEAAAAPAAAAPGAGSAAAAADLLYRPAWYEAPAAPPGSGRLAGRWLLLADAEGVGERLAARLAAAGGRVALAAASAGGFADLGGGRYALDPARPGDFARLAAALGAGGPLSGIVHLWSLDAPTRGPGRSGADRPSPEGGRGRDLTGAAVDAAAARGFWSLLRLAGALEAAAGGDGGPLAAAALDWTVVTPGVAAVTGDEPAAAADALLLGPCWSFPYRHPGWRCRAVDVVPPGGAAGLDEVAGRLFGEIAAAAAEPAGPADPLVALRGRRRWRRRLEPAPAAAPETAQTLRPRGVYWITGGLGGVGLALARFLAGSVQARLVLTGRTPLPPRERWTGPGAAGDDPRLAERLRRLLDLEAAGAELLVASADVTRRGEMAAVLEQVRARWGAVHGVIHAAGGSGDGAGSAAAGAAEDEAATAALLAPKVEGTRVLLDLLAGEPLDFVALCSSLASLRGGPSAGYCAASAFLDAVAEERAGRAPRVLSIGWDTWREDGAAAAAAARETDPVRRRRLAGHLAGALATAAACRAFHLALGTAEPHLAVTARGPGQAARAAAAATSAALAAGAGKPAPAAWAAPAEEGKPAADGAPEPLFANAVEGALAGIWSELLGRGRVAPDDDFFHLGGDSLLATQLMTRIQERFGADLPLAAIFEAPTVRRLAARVDPGLAAAAGAPGEPAPGPAVPGSTVPGPAAPPAPRRVELSLGQQRLWFLDRLEPGSAAYHLPGAFRLTGDLDAAALGAAFAAVVERHQALRTRFPADPEGRATAVVEPPRGFPLRRIDLAALPAGRRLPEALRLAAAEAAAPFDLAAGPPIRAALARLGAGDHALLLNVHHIVADLWSMGILLREVAALYAAARAGRRSPLPPLPVQFAEWAARQRRELTGERLAEQAAYWRRLLAGELPVLELPTDRPRPRSLGGRGRRVAVALPEAASRALVDCARGRGATLFMAVAAAWAALLHRHSGQGDLVIGFPIAGRRSREAEPLIGFFVNTLVLRVRLAGATRFDALLAEVRRRRSTPSPTRSCRSSELSSSSTCRVTSAARRCFRPWSASSTRRSRRRPSPASSGSRCRSRSAAPSSTSASTSPRTAAPSAARSRSTPTSSTPPPPRAWRPTSRRSPRPPPHGRRPRWGSCRCSPPPSATSSWSSGAARGWGRRGR